MFAVFSANAQLTDLVRLEYSFIPMQNSEDDYTRFRGLVNYPIKIKEDAYIIVGGEYNQVNLELEDEYPFDTSLLERIHIMDLSLGYTFKMNEKWRFGAKLTPRIASTLNSSISSDDFFINAGVFFINDRSADESAKNPYRLILGLTYNSTTGIPFPLPLVNYHREINDKWSFSVGVPKTNLKYTFNDKKEIQTFLTIDGYNANIQKGIVVDTKQADSISLSVLIVGLGYEYFLTKHLASYIYTGYTLSLTNSLENKNREEIFSLNEVKTFYLRTGIKIKI
jgi:hypothetical protein